jgi:hypothetical protein
LKNSSYFLILVFLSIVLAELYQIILNVDGLFISSLAEQFSYEQISKAANSQKKWEWISYLFIPVLSLLKISIISAILDMGCFFFEREIKYKKLFNIVLKAEFIFLLVIIFKTTWFYFFKSDYTFDNLQYFYPLSALNIIGYQGLETWLIYPFQVLNLFEVAYWFILAYLIGKEINDTTDKGFSIVASSYGVGLLIWVVGVMFLTLNMS